MTNQTPQTPKFPHLRKHWWKYLLAAALIAGAIFVWPVPQIRENRAEKAQLAETYEKGCTADGEVDPAGNPVVFEDSDRLGETDWVCEAESPNGPYAWVRKPAEEAPVLEPEVEPEGEAIEPPPATEEDDASATYSVDGDTVMVYADGELIAEVTFVTTVDNMPTEWLRDREGIAYLYQSGIGNQVELIVALHEHGAFAIDGDWMSYGDADLGIVDNSADFRAFADGAGTYRFTASSFGLAVGSFRSDSDKAGFVLQDRRNADNGDGRPEYWLDPAGEVVEIK